jgi:glutamate/tyrosine decarboxylase-like PLP-dependent enzyme
MIDDASARERALFADAASRGVAYLTDIRERRVAPDAAALARLPELGGPLPRDGEDPAHVLALLDEVGSPGTVANAGGRYFGFVNGGALPAARAASVLAAAWDQNAALRSMSPVAATLEDIALGWLRTLLGLPDDTAGAFVTGATMANVTCLAAARHAVLARQGWDVEARGLRHAPDTPVIVGEEVHATVLKALALLGLGREEVVRVPTDEQGRMRASELPPLTSSTIVCVQAGNVNTGAFDPVGQVCDAARAAGAWVHVDGAFGLWAAASPLRAHFVPGISAADSWAMDAHKWLNVPYDSGIALVRDPMALGSAMSVQAAYLPSGAAREPMQWTPESSRRARGVEVWASLRSLGHDGLVALMEQNCRQAVRIAEGLAQAGHRVLNDVVLNQVLVAFDDVAHTARVIERIQQDGVCWCGGTVWKGITAMRVSVSSWATTDRDIEVSLAAMLDAAATTRGGR